MDKLGKIFMLDDDIVLLDMYRHLLEGMGFDVFTTSNAYKFLMYAKEIQPNVFILDLNMPETNGWDVLMRLKEEDLLKKIPVVILTVESDPDLAQASGVAHFLHKPLEADKLKEIVETYSVGNKKHDLLLIDDFRPLFSALKSEMDKRDWRYFEVHDLGAAKVYLSKNTPKAVGIGLSDQPFEKVRPQIDHARVFKFENLQNLDQLAPFIK